MGGVGWVGLGWVGRWVGGLGWAGGWVGLLVHIYTLFAAKKCLLSNHGVKQ